MVSVGGKDSHIEFPGVTSNPCNDFYFFTACSLHYLQNEALIEKEGERRMGGGGRARRGVNLP